MTVMLAVLALSGVLDSTRVTGTVVALASGRALAGVQVSLGSAATVTDTAGSFVLTVPAGIRPRFAFAWNGRIGTAATESLDDAPYAVVIDTEADQLDPQVASADWRLPGVWGMTGFFARRDFGYGHFYTRDDLRQDGYANLRGLLAAAGVQHSCVRREGCGPVWYGNGRVHFIHVWVDGVIQTGEYADSVPLEDVAGVEYYAPVVPPYPTWASTRWVQYTRYFLGEPTRGSMVIIWTRNYRRPIRR